MGIGEIANVNEIADTGSVRCGIVGSIDLEQGTLAACSIDCN